jgi:hypothetical protein
VRNKARKWVLAALDDIARAMPFPILGVDSDKDRSSSITTCWLGVSSARSSSPGRGRATRMTVATSMGRINLTGVPVLFDGARPDVTMPRATANTAARS